RLCIEADPQEAHDRYHHANTDRRIVAEPTIEGTTNLHGFDLAPDQVAKAMRRINHLAQSLRRTGESRTIDQLRADVYLDLLNGTRHHSTKDSRGVVDIRVDLATLTRLSEHPGELAGYGPVIADIARRVADNSTDAEWRYTVTDSTSGHITHTGTTQRRHTAKQRRHIEVRDQTCIFPGCRIPATTCDIDHTTAHSEGGPTTVVNGGPLCRHDHGTKHKHRCTYLRLPTGDYQWTSRLGHTYTTSGQPP
ncbi:MAG: HNH endonuclease, partial [Acidimicrobiia bacterium]|nr:HNH endonuclease [Acidimicrobiia bacterium]